MRQFGAHCVMLLVNGPPHILPRGLDSFPLPGAQLRPEKLIQGFLFAVLPPSAKALLATLQKASPTNKSK
jgi:hypothetical protein